MTVLFDSTPTVGDIQLSDNASNYKRLKIFANTSDGNKVFTEIYNPQNGVKFVLNAINSSASTTSTPFAWIKIGTYTISGATIESTSTTSGEISLPDHAKTVSDAYIRITRVEGWKI